MKPKISIFEAELEGFRWLQVSAVRQGACVATATVYYLFDADAAPQLCNLFVEEAARRQGVATAIMRAVADQLKRPYCLHVVRDSPAHVLYHGLGFLSIGAVKEKENSIWMLSPTPNGQH